MTWVINDAGYPIWKPDTEYGSAPPVGGAGSRFVEGMPLSGRGNPIGLATNGPGIPSVVERLPEQLGMPGLDWMQTMPERSAAAADAAIGSWMQPYNATPTLDPRTGQSPTGLMGPSSLPSAAPPQSGGDATGDLAGIQGIAQQVMNQNAASAAAAASVAETVADPATQALQAEPDPLDPNNAVPSAAGSTTPAVGMEGQPSGASVTVAPAVGVPPAPGVPTPPGTAPAPVPVPAPGSASIAPAAAPAATPTQPTPKAPLAKPETPQAYALHPSGTVVVLKPGQKAPPGYSTVMLTPSAAQTIANKGRPPAAAAPVKPVDPGAALDAPTQGQIDQDSTPLPTQNSPLGAFVNVDPLTAIAAANGIRMGQHVVNPNDSAAIKAQYGSQTKALVQEISSGSMQGQAILKQVAQLAWYRQTKGEQGPPENAPVDYIASWAGAYRTGRLVTNGASLDLSIAQSGMTPPAVKSVLSTPPKAAGPVNGGSAQAGHAYAIGKVAQMSQYDAANYNSQQQYQAWKDSACGAASFASLLNSTLPEGQKWTIGKAVDYLSGKGLISQSQGLLRGADFRDITKAVNEAAGKDIAFTVNYRDSATVTKHFAEGGGAIMFTGPGAGGGWNYTHIYVVTGATPEGVQVVDSSNSQGGKQSITWDQFQRQTAGPGMGAGTALISGRTNPVAAAGGNPALLTQNAQQAGGGAVLSQGGPLGYGSTRAKEEGGWGAARPSSEGGRGGLNSNPTPAAGEMEAYTRQAAAARGIDPEIAIRVGNSEGGFRDPVRQSEVINSRGQRERSYGPFQMYMDGGLGNAAAKVGIDVQNPAHWQAAIDFALDTAKSSGWGQWYGAAKVGIGNWDGLR